MFFFGCASLRDDGARGSIIKLGGIKPVNKSKHGSKTSLQVSKGLIGVFYLGHIHPGQSGRDTFSKVSRYLHLTQQRKHIGKQTRLQQCIWINLFFKHMGLSFTQYALKTSQHLFEDGNGAGVNRVGHGNFH